MSQSNFYRPVFVLHYDGSIKETTFGQYLSDYWNDETTSPRGIENRRFVKAVLLNEEGKVEQSAYSDTEFYGNDESNIKHAVYSWGIGGRGPARIDSIIYDTEEEPTMIFWQGLSMIT